MAKSQQSKPEVVVAAAEDRGTGEVEEIVAVVVVAAANNKVRPEPPQAGATTQTVGVTPPGAPDTPQTLRPAAVTTTIGGAPKVGSV